jgi:hypothetical protein
MRSSTDPMAKPRGRVVVRFIVLMLQGATPALFQIKRIGRPLGRPCAVSLSEEAYGRQ